MISIYYLLRRITQPAYRIKGIGLGRVCELVRRCAAKYAPQEPLLISNFRGDAFFKCFLKEHMGGQIFFRGSYSGDQLTIIERLLRPDGVFIDAGANQGEFSIAAARIVQNGTVFAFEPVSEYRERLNENIRLNGFTNIKVVACALGDKDDLMSIYDQQEVYTDGTRNEGLPTLFASKLRRHPREVVPVKKLDDVLKDYFIVRVDIIKLDIEGAEWIALRGAINTIRNYRPILLLEIGRDTCRAAGHEPEELVEWLTNLNYRIEKITGDEKIIPINPVLLDDFQNIIAFPA